MQKNPKVSVCVVAYNQEKYIEYCLKSIVNQIVDFDYEILVGVDLSSDETAAIAEMMAEKYPEKIKVIKHGFNVGAAVNYKSVHDMARGEYIAHCDGDDAWLPGKLMHQVQLLDENPSISQCWGCAYLIDDNGENIGVFPSKIARALYPEIIYANDIALSYALVGQHSTQMYRRAFKFEFDASKPILDYFVAFNMALKGPAIYSKKIIGEYRQTTSPSLTRTDNNKKFAVDCLADHLQDIIFNNPDCRNEAYANLRVRHFFSTIKGHDTRHIKTIINELDKKSFKIKLLIKSVVYFLFQKM